MSSSSSAVLSPPPPTPPPPWSFIVIEAVWQSKFDVYDPWLIRRMIEWHKSMKVLHACKHIGLCRLQFEGSLLVVVCVAARDADELFQYDFNVRVYMGDQRVLEVDTLECGGGTTYFDYTLMWKYYRHVICKDKELRDIPNPLKYRDVFQSAIVLVFMMFDTYASRMHTPMRTVISPMVVERSMGDDVFKNIALMLYFVGNFRKSMARRPRPRPRHKPLVDGDSG